MLPNFSFAKDNNLVMKDIVKGSKLHIIILSQARHQYTKINDTRKQQ